MKRVVPVFIVAITGAVLVVSFFLPKTESWSEKAVTWFNILAAIAYVLGAGNLVKVQLASLSARRPGWAFALITLIAFFVTLGCGLLKVGVHPEDQYPNYPWSGDFQESSSPFGWIYDYFFTPLTATMFASLAFYVASAAFRAFRAKNLDAFLLLGTAFIVLLGRTAAARITDGLPQALSFLSLDSIVAAIMSYVSTAGGRAITIGIALGVAATSLRILLGVDRPYLGRE